MAIVDVTKRDLLRLMRDAKPDAVVEIAACYMESELRALALANGQPEDAEYVVIVKDDRVILATTYP